MLSTMNIKSEKHSQFGLANSELDENKVDAKIAFVPINITTTASIVGVIAVFLLIICICRCAKQKNIEDLYEFVCVQHCKPKRRQQDIEMTDESDWQEHQRRTPKDYGERVRDLIGESNELARHLNASTGRELEKT